MNHSIDNAAARLADNGPQRGEQHEAEPSPAAARDRRESRRWWIKLCLQPLLLLAAGMLLFVGLGLAQRWGLLPGGSKAPPVATSEAQQRYICPMMCTPPLSAPGRCPKCGMELVPLTGGGGGDIRSITIDPATRRIAGIQTVAVKATSMSRAIRVVGEIRYDEGSLKTLSAYVDGRLERLYADYTGVVVNKGDQLALVYSPRLYSGQVELLLARQARQDSRGSSLSRVRSSNLEIYESSRQRLIELGMTESQIDRLERVGKADSRLELAAPISGTVIEKLAAEGQYVKEGQAIYRLADLSTVWLMLKLFPDDVGAIRYGQKVEAELQSLPGRLFSGRVAFVDPVVDPQTRTVGVRVVISNPDGMLRVGDYASATIHVPVAGEGRAAIYDPELANKWISPRHPHIVESSPGSCSVCGMDLVPAAEFGFTAQPQAAEALVLPRDAVLMAGNNSVVYVETEPGRFEIRPVVLGPSAEGQIVILHGVRAGERVATRGNFLIDSQMQLVGNPSLIDPTKAAPPTVAADAPAGGAIDRALAALSPADRELARRQGVCPVADAPLGSMGPPPKVDLDGTPVFICCEGCRGKLLADPQSYLAKLARMPKPTAKAKPTDTLLPPREQSEPAAPTKQRGAAQ